MSANLAVGPAPAYCRRCGYSLRGLEGGRCPECGRSFDPSHPKTFLRRPPRLMLRRWLRRTSAVTSLLLAVVGIGIAWLWADWHAEQPSLSDIRSLGGYVQVRPIGPAWLRRRWPERWAYLLDRADDVHYAQWNLQYLGHRPRVNWTRLRHLRSVELNYSPLTDVIADQLGQLRELRALYAHLSTLEESVPARLARFPALVTLDLSHTNVTDADLGHWRGNTRLRVLRLWHTNVGNAGLANLSRVPALEDLDLADTRVTDEGLPHLYGLASLRDIDLRGTKVSPAGLRQLKIAFPRATIRSDEVPGPPR